MKKLILAFTACTAVSGAQAASAPGVQHAAEEASIPFAHRTVNNFHPVDRDTVYLETPGQWYRATLALDCRDLQFSHRIGIDTRGASALDRFGAIIVGDRRCPIQSLVKSDPPARKE